MQHFWQMSAVLTVASCRDSVTFLERNSVTGV